MTRVVYKHNLPLTGSMLEYRIPRLVPMAALPVVHVGLQHDVPCFWFETDKDMPNSASFMVVCIGTGWDIPEGTVHMGTVIDRGGYVWHYYARWM